MQPEHGPAAAGTQFASLGDEMLRRLRDLKGYRIEATDGELGSVRDILFDDESWTVRYMVAATGPWLLGKRVLVGWPALGQPDWDERNFPVSLTKEQVKHSPHVSVDEPVSRRQERSIHDHYGWRPYWGVVMAKAALKQAGIEADESATPPSPEDETHLRSVREVVDYEVRAQDEKVGVVADFLADDYTWIIKEMVVEMGGLLSKQEMIVDATWIEDVDWAHRVVTLGLPAEQFEDAVVSEPREVPAGEPRPIV